MSQNQGLNADPIHQFLIECHNITSQATFIIDSLPNAESAAIEGVVHQLYAIRTILHSLNDDQMDEDDVNRSVTYIDAVLKPLQDFLDNPPPPPSTTLPQIRTGKRGRPRYALDLQRVILLHDLGNTWDSVAEAVGVCKQTLYNHLDLAGLSPARREHTQISDDDLDNIVGEISLAHPFSGSSTVMGLLESRNIHIPRKRVQDSVRRVDAIGVLVRCVCVELAINI